MKITTITYTKRKNEGDYSYSEYNVVANLEEEDDVLECYNSLKQTISDVIDGKAAAAVKVEEVIPEVTAPAVKEKKTRAKKEIVKEVTVEAVIPEIKEAPVGKNVVVYNRDLDTHRQLLSSYLNKNFPQWKTVVGVKEFSMGLVGKHFLNDDGAVVESFATLLSDFFNA